MVFRYFYAYRAGACLKKGCERKVTVHTGVPVTLVRAAGSFLVGVVGYLVLCTQRAVNIGIRVALIQ